MRIAVATARFKQPIKSALKRVGPMGATGVQLSQPQEVSRQQLGDTGRRQFLNYLRELDISVASLDVPAQKSLFDLSHLDRRIEELKSAMTLAFQLNATIVTTRVGRIPEKESSDFSTLSAVLNDLARHGNTVGTTLVITPSGDVPEALLRLVNDIDAGPIGINFDPASFAMTSQNAANAFRELHTSTIQVRVRDGIRDIDGSGLEVPVGRGDVDWPEILSLILDADYRGWYICDRTQGDDIPTDIARSIKFLQTIHNER